MARLRQRTAKVRPRSRLRVAVCIDTRDGPGRERLLGIYEYAVQRNWSLILVRQDNAAAIRRVVEMRVDGAILFDRSAEFHRQLRRHGIFCVETSARNLKLDDVAIFVDDAAVGETAARHLESLGLEHFAYCGPTSTQAPAARRASSFTRYLAQRRHSVDAFSDISASGESSYRTLHRWLRRLPTPVGILAFDDKIAECVIVASQWAGLQVPNQVAVVGVGNDELICELLEPKISSVCIPTREIGRRAAAAIEARHQGRSQAREQELHSTEVAVRASTERLLTHDPKVLAVMELIRTRAHCPFGTDQIVDAVGIPRRTLERRFVASTGRTVHEFILECRLALAKRLLRRTGGTISDVSRQCGYAALTAFTRMFIERVGCHPDDYRRRSL